MRDLERFGIYQDAYERAAADVDAYLLKRTGGAQLKFKTKEDALVTEPSSGLVHKMTVTPRAPLQSTVTHTTMMDKATQEKWNAWVDRRIWKILNEAGEIIADEVGKLDRHVMDTLRAEIAALRAEVKQLRESNVTPIGGRRVS
jgi:hypothetical protein